MSLLIINRLLSKKRIVGALAAVALGAAAALSMPASPPSPPPQGSQSVRQDPAEKAKILRARFDKAKWCYSAVTEARKRFAPALRPEENAIAQQHRKRQSELKVHESLPTCFPKEMAYPGRGLDTLPSSDPDVLAYALFKEQHAEGAFSAHWFLQQTREPWNLQLGNFDFGRPVVDDETKADRRKWSRSVFRRDSAEESLIQRNANAKFPPYVYRDVPSANVPAKRIRGVRIQSGDVLLSRGAAPTSALISRASDEPSVFSHAAIVHISEAEDEQDRTATVIEAHIESGLGTTSLGDYLGDGKRRLLVLRYDTTERLPHVAAEFALKKAKGAHVAYDFAMDQNDPSKVFCSEVPYEAYRSVGIGLWRKKATFSHQGARRWLTRIGVKNFETLAPGAAENDSKLIPVAEWFDSEELFLDHVDNVVADTLLSAADKGLSLDYAWYKLPFARLAKVYSVLLETFGNVGPIPEGMSADAALRVEELRKMHRSLAAKLLELKPSDPELKYPPLWELYEHAASARISNDN